MASVATRTRTIRAMARLSRPSGPPSSFSSLFSSPSACRLFQSACFPAYSRHWVASRPLMLGSSCSGLQQSRSNDLTRSALQKLVASSSISSSVSSSSSSRHGSSGWHDNSEWIKDNLAKLLPLLSMASIGICTATTQLSSREVLCEETETQQQVAVHTSSKLKDQTNRIVEEVKRLLTLLWKFAQSMTEEASIFFGKMMDGLRQHVFPQFERVLSQLENFRKSMLASDVMATAQLYFDAGRKSFADNIGCFGRTDMHKSMAASLTRYVDEFVELSMKFADQIVEVLRQGMSAYPMTFVSNAPSSPQEVAPEHDKNSPPPKAAGSIPPGLLPAFDSFAHCLPTRRHRLRSEQKVLGARIEPNSRQGDWRREGYLLAKAEHGRTQRWSPLPPYRAIRGGRASAARCRSATLLLSRPRCDVLAKASEEAANAIREALYILKATPEVKSALGENLKEARMNLLSGGKSAINGQIAVKGEKGQGTLSIEAAKSEFGAEMHVRADVSLRSSLTVSTGHKVVVEARRWH
eukprot:768464-Hanusia_phi.AAC.11